MESAASKIRIDLSQNASSIVDGLPPSEIRAFIDLATLDISKNDIFREHWRISHPRESMNFFWGGDQPS